jgi:signal transduction histidine kinase
MKQRHLSLQWKFLFSIALIICPILGIIFGAAVLQNHNQAMEQVLNQARILSRQLILTRQWVADCGGVMALKESAGAKGAVGFSSDMLETAHGIYQRFTPSMVTKKLSEYSLRQNLYQFQISSINPLNPDNRADAFEKKALTRFRAEPLTELTEFHTQGREKYIRYMVPLHMDASCRECHSQQDFPEGSVIGGLSVLLPINTMMATLKNDHLKLAASGVGLILVTILTLFILLRRIVIKPLNQLEGMAGEIGNGNLDARVKISTGDEFEKVGVAFNTMAWSLSRGRNLLQDTIKTATRDLSQANRELKTLDQLKSDFIANMSHELRSPLTVIRGGVDYLKRTIKGENNLNYLGIIDKNLSRLIHLVSDLFDFTRIEAKKIDWSFERENVSDLVREVMEILAPLAEKKNISVTYEGEMDVFSKIDLERIEQVLVNLLENAIKFSDEGGRIQMGVRKKREKVLVTVKDHGIGISGESLEAIFEKFHTLPSSEEKGRREGTGLGLAISKGIISAHGGDIWAESIQDKGSTFFFTLPKK